MREYPVWLIERVAIALALANNDYDESDGWIWSPYRDDAVSVLNALGFQNEPNMPNIWQSAYLYPAKGEI